MPVDPTQFPEAAHKFAHRALRELQRAEKNAAKAVEHAVKSGQALLKAYNLCEYGHCDAFFEMRFPQDDEKRLSLLTARTYMQLARNWWRLSARRPEVVSSQRQAVTALAAITPADKSDPDGASSAARCRSGEGVTVSGATALPRPFQKESRAQRYICIARRLPASQLDATRVSRQSQTAVLRAMRGVVFTGSALLNLRAIEATVVPEE